METEYTMEKGAREMEEEKRRVGQTRDALLSQIKKYQTGIKEIKAIMTTLDEKEELTENLKSHYKGIIEDYRRLQRRFGEELRQIYASSRPSPSSIPLN